MGFKIIYQYMDPSVKYFSSMYLIAREPKLRLRQILQGGSNATRLHHSSWFDS